MPSRPLTIVAVCLGYVVLIGVVLFSALSLDEISVAAPLSEAEAGSADPVQTNDDSQRAEAGATEIPLHVFPQTGRSAESGGGESSSSASGEAQAAVPGGGKVLNYLIIGVDRRPGDSIGRADVIMVGHADLRTNRAGLLSIPRDLLVSIPGYGTDRINTAFARGELANAGDGPRLLSHTIEQNFGIRPEYYAVVDFGCFRTVVDAVGGVTVNVSERIVDPSYPTDNYGYRTVVFNPGVQTLDGERALEYVRTRAGSNDFARMHRQQQVLWAIRHQALQPAIIGSIPSIAADCKGLSTNVPMTEAAALAFEAREIEAESISLQVIEAPLIEDYITSRGAMVLRPRWDLIRPLVQTIFPNVMASDSGSQPSASLSREAG